MNPQLLSLSIACEGSRIITQNIIALLSAFMADPNSVVIQQVVSNALASNFEILSACATKAKFAEVPVTPQFGSSAPNGATLIH